MVGEPSWWYGRADGVLPQLLQPFGTVYGRLVERRIERTEPYRSRLPVVCVGNFTAGGTGKTPFTQMLVEMLGTRPSSARAVPAILTRGYGGTERGPHWVDRQVDTAERVGDEPLLLAATAPVLVARDRAAGARAIEADPRGFTHIFMDDGLQNPGLAKTLSLALVDGVRGFGNGRVIPAGPLRAPLDGQMARVDAIIVNAGQSGASEPSAIARSLMHRFTGPVLEAHVTARFDPATLAGKPVVAFAGIGVPQKFFALLETLGISVVARVPYADHHAFAEREASTLLEDARRLRARLLTTEKDLARLSGMTGARGELAAVAQAVPIRLTLGERDHHRLAALIDPLL